MSDDLRTRASAGLNALRLMFKEHRQTLENPLGNPSTGPWTDLALDEFKAEAQALGAFVPEVGHLHSNDAVALFNLVSDSFTPENEERLSRLTEPQKAQWRAAVVDYRNAQAALQVARDDAHTRAAAKTGLNALRVMFREHRETLENRRGNPNAGPWIDLSVVELKGEARALQAFVPHVRHLTPEDAVSLFNLVNQSFTPENERRIAGLGEPEKAKWREAVAEYRNAQAAVRAARDAAHVRAVDTIPVEEGSAKVSGTPLEERDASAGWLPPAPQGGDGN